MGCATWSGVRLRDVLGACGLDVDGIATRKAEVGASVFVCAKRKGKRRRGGDAVHAYRCVRGLNHALSSVKL